MGYLDELIRFFGKHGNYYHQIARAKDDRIVTPNRIRKSVGVENTFEDDIINPKDILYQLKILENELKKSAGKASLKGRTLTLKVKFQDFEQITRSKTSIDPIHPTAIKPLYIEMLDRLLPIQKKIRLLGLTLSNSPDSNEFPLQLTLGF